MKISNFQFIGTIGKTYGNMLHEAHIDVTTRFLWWEKTVRLRIYRKCAGNWYFGDTGRFTPGTKVEELEKAWAAKTGELKL